MYFQYHNQPTTYSEALDYLNMIFTGVFTVEFLLKLAAFRVKVRRYISDFTSQDIFDDISQKEIS